MKITKKKCRAPGGGVEGSECLQFRLVSLFLQFQNREPLSLLIVCVVTITLSSWRSVVRRSFECILFSLTTTKSSPFRTYSALLCLWNMLAVIWASVSIISYYCCGFCHYQLLSLGQCHKHKVNRRKFSHLVTYSSNYITRLLNVHINFAGIISGVTCRFWLIVQDQGFQLQFCQVSFWFCSVVVQSAVPVFVGPDNLDWEPQEE